MKNLLVLLLALSSLTVFSQTIIQKDTSFVFNSGTNAYDTIIKTRTFKVSATAVVTTKIDTSTLVDVRPHGVVIPPVVSPSTVTITLDTIPFSDPEVVGAARGLNDFYNGQAFSYTSSDNYYRFLWSQLQTGATTFDWSNLDNQIKASIDKAQKITIGINSVCTTCTVGDGNGTLSYGGANSSFPLFLHTLMQSESVKDWVFSSSWIPNWNSESYLSNVEKFMTALASHLNTAPTYKGFTLATAIYALDIRMFGNWGEWHTDGFTEPTGTHAADASLIRIAKAHIAAFTDTWLIANISAFDTRYVSNAVGYFMLTAQNNKGNIGKRIDHLGDLGITNFDTLTSDRSYTTGGVTINFKTEIKKSWMKAPFTGEPMNSATSTKPSGGTSYQNLIKDDQYYHLSQFSNVSSATDGGAATNFAVAAKASGYRDAIMGGNYTASKGSLSILMNWSNSGLTPTYESWDVYFELRQGSTVVWTNKSSFSPKLFLPGRVSITDSYALPTTLTGTYSLYVIVKDPTGYRKPLQLANRNRGTDGAYLFASGVVIQ